MRVLADELSAEELQEYVAYYGFEPWGSVPDDMRAALVAYRVAGALGAKGSFGDYLPRWEPPRRLSYAEGAAMFAAFAVAHNGTVGKGA